MPYDVQTKTTDIIMCNSKNLGALIVKDEPHVKSWDEPQCSIHNVGIEESYGFGVLNEGQAIGVIKNVKVIGQDSVVARCPPVTSSQSSVVAPLAGPAGRRCPSGLALSSGRSSYRVFYRAFSAAGEHGSDGC
jgi:hypothetical protein